MALLSKSKYIQGLQCKKLLWLTVKKSDVLEYSPIQTHIFNQGQIVGELAHNLFLDGQLINSDLSFFDKISKTTQSLDLRKPIFEASFLWNKTFCMVDILNPVDDAWEIIEVKSSTSVKPIHLDDLAFQYTVLSNVGLNIKKLSVYTINSNYVKDGSINIENLFNQNDVTENVLLKVDTTKNNIYSLKTVLIDPNEPEIPIGPQCSSPYSCPAKDYCWQSINKTHTIFNLMDLSLNKKFEHYYRNEIDLFNLDILSSYSKKQKIQLSCIQESLDFIDRQRIKSYFSKLKFPLAFLDFECYQEALPQYDGVSPYTQIPFMFSIYIYDGKDLNHINHIFKPNENPFESISRALIEYLPSEGSIVVYNKSFESLIIRNCSKFVPKLEKNLIDFNSRLFDIEIPFKKQWVYLRDFNGKTSIKNVLPALSPQLEYDQLEISSGESINGVFNEYLKDSNNYDIKNKLIDYVKLDTYAMYLIYKKLISFI